MKINEKNLGINTASCSDVNGTQEFKCECNDRFDGKRCEIELPFQCEGNPCCENGPNALCCANGGVCSDDNFVFNGSNSDECQCLCDDDFTGLNEFKCICNKSELRDRV